MNRNYYRGTSNGKPPIGFIIGIIFALFGVLGAVPLLAPLLVIVAIVAIVFAKRGKSDNRSNADKYVRNNSARTNNAGKIIETKDIVVADDELNTEGYKNKTDIEKRLEMLKNLYVNGFMERDEYEEKCKKLTGGK